MTDVQRLTGDQLEHLKTAVNAPENPIKYLSIDPGKSNGVCGYDVKFYLQFMSVVHADDMVRYLAQFRCVHTCIVEGYRVFPNKAKQHIYSDLETPRVIGRVEAWAETNAVELEKQPSTIKTTGYKWVGQKPLAKTNPQNHPMDAHIHFIYWAVVHGHIKPEELSRRYP